MPALHCSTANDVRSPGVVGNPLSFVLADLDWIDLHL